MSMAHQLPNLECVDCKRGWVELRSWLIHVSTKTMSAMYLGS